jgi:hypothetical protein
VPGTRPLQAVVVGAGGQVQVERHGVRTGAESIEVRTYLHSRATRRILTRKQLRHNSFYQWSMNRGIQSLNMNISVRFIHWGVEIKSKVLVRTHLERIASR